MPRPYELHRPMRRRRLNTCPSFAASDAEIHDAGASVVIRNLSRETRAVWHESELGATNVRRFAG